MHQRPRNNVMILELVIVILFFTLSVSVIMQVFVKAHVRSDESVKATEALVEIENWAGRIRVSENPEEMLLAQGWSEEDGQYRLLVESQGIRYSIDAERETFEHGELLRFTIRAYNTNPTGGLIVELPVECYLRKGGAAA